MNLDHLEALHAVRDLGLRLQPSDAGPGGHFRASPVHRSSAPCSRSIEPEGIPVSLGAQNCAIEDSGAFTGEVSAVMLARLHVEYVIVGHSERRRLFGEVDEVVAAKVRAVLRNGMTPICCVGENLEERELGVTKERLATQVEFGARHASAEDASAGMVIAYEPVWAIGTGRAASPEDAQEACSWIRQTVGTLCQPGGGRSGPHPVRGIGHRGEHRIPDSAAPTSTARWWAGPAWMPAAFVGIVRAAARSGR